MNFFSIRKDIYQHNITMQKSRGENLISLRYPYSTLKSIYYVETASIFLFTTQKIIKSPNFITLIYILFGVVGSFLVAISPSKTLFYIGLFMVFTKGTFDWADGVLARKLNKTSFLGHALDVYGANICDAAFRLAFVFYTLKYYPDYMFLLPLFSFFLLITRFNIFSDFLFLKQIQNSSDNIQKKIINNYEKDFSQEKKLIYIIKLYKIYISFLDERARGIDLLLLVLLFDALSDENISYLLLILSFLIILRSLIKYFVTSYLAFKNYKNK
mgnify:CR=1 FL=1|tara:strand:- start:5356 stop:6168 length:813 start_codon:yes stop_codon:yes gene_type:complete